MGRDLISRCVLGEHDEVLRAQLETTELILRGARIRHRWPLSVVGEVKVDEDRLQFVAADACVTLYLGGKEAAAWARKIATPPPTLAAKLGLSTASPALVIGDTQDPALEAALAGAITQDTALATQLIAVVVTKADLAAALALHASLACRPVWIVHRKGKSKGTGMQLGGTGIRSAMRQLGYVDTKVSAVSDDLSATRYTLRILS